MLLLTQPECVLCDEAKGLLGRLRAEYPLDIELIDFYSARGFVLAKAGRMLSPPGIVLDGQPFSYGRLSERKLREALAARLEAISGEGT